MYLLLTFTQHTIRDLFDVEDLDQDRVLGSSNAGTIVRNPRTPPDVDMPAEEQTETNKSLILESALTAAEDETDVQAARTVRAEAAAELAEFDESIPLEELGEVFI